jgi:hypothetical protein
MRRFDRLFDSPCAHVVEPEFLAGKLTGKLSFLGGLSPNALHHDEAPEPSALRDVWVTVRGGDVLSPGLSRKTGDN